MWRKMLDPIDKFIDSTSMYRLLLYYLVGLVIAAVGLSAVGDMHYSAIAIAVEAALSVTACWIINKVFAYIFNAPVNPESSLLTGLILALIIPPDLQLYSLMFVVAAAGLAIGSKYLLTIGNKHIFNPAAVAVVLAAWGPHQSASWWVGTAVLLPFVLIGGMMTVRKVRRGYMVTTFLAATTITTAVMALASSTSLATSMHNMLLTSSVFFLGFVMLTEPYTSPTTKTKQIWYAALVGVLMSPQVHFGSIYTTPEIALVIGNIFAYTVSPKVKLFPTFRGLKEVARSTYEFSFIPGKKLAFEPGQYMEFTLPHTKADNRGSRRWFTLASSPTEDRLLLGIKFYDNGSSFKHAMLEMDQNSQIVAAQLAGDFVMPKDKTKKLVFIAGGIGVTPFRSMVKYLIDTQEKRNVRILYSARTEADFAYIDVFEQARQSLGIQTAYVATDEPNTTIPHAISGTIDKDGTHPMVETLQETLENIGVHRHNIKIDFFPGYA
jgi:glycine betaine catabolism B